MFYTIGYWLVAVPLGEPWRAIVLVAEVLVLAYTLHWLWELSFVLAGRIRKVASRSYVAVISNPVRESRSQPTIQDGRIPVKVDEVA